MKKIAILAGLAVFLAAAILLTFPRKRDKVIAVYVPAGTAVASTEKQERVAHYDEVLLTLINGASERSPVIKETIFKIHLTSEGYLEASTVCEITSKSRRCDTNFSESLFKILNQDEFVAVMAHEVAHATGIYGEHRTDVFAIGILIRCGRNPGALATFFDKVSARAEPAESEKTRIISTKKYLDSLK